MQRRQVNAKSKKEERKILRREDVPVDEKRKRLEEKPNKHCKLKNANIRKKECRCRLVKRETDLNLSYVMIISTIVGQDFNCIACRSMAIIK